MSFRIALTLSVLLWVPFALPQAATFKGSPEAPDFTLTRADGGRYQLRSRPGRVVLLYFGFTHCANVCPQALGSLSGLLARLTPTERSGLDAVFITVDPERDTPTQVRAFLSRFNADFIGLIPDEGELERLRQGYHLSARRIQEPGEPDYDMVHTDLIYVVGPGGRLRHAFFAGTGVDSMLADVRALLLEAPR